MVWIAKHQHEIIAACRIMPLPDQSKLLTGVYVNAQFRQQGIASQLVTQASANQTKLFTFALIHLSDFYQTLGFKIMDYNDLPCELAQRFTAYVKQGRQIVAMIKQ